MKEVICENGVCRLVDAAEGQMAGVIDETVRIAHGYMDVESFLDFLSGSGSAMPGSGWAAILSMAFLGGLALNLTPCVLPMVPVNLAIIGNSWKKAIFYSLGIASAYGSLGVASAVAGAAFGSIQSNPFFNAGVAIVFAALSCSLFGLFHIDFSRYRFRCGAFLMGMLSAVLSGACVAPVLVSVLLLTADLYAGGNVFALFLPFVMGLGMALPWPFLAVGMKILPKPGAWMRYINILFAVAIAVLALRYAKLSWDGFFAVSGNQQQAEDGIWTALSSPEEFSLEGLRRPVLVDCWASWCGNCARMDKTTLSDRRVVEKLEGFTPIKLQSEDMGKLRRIKGFENIKGLPAFVIFE